MLLDNTWVDDIDTDGNSLKDDLFGWDFLGVGDNDPLDQHRHGTHVTGTIAAIGNNALGVSGVNWQARVMPLRFLNESNEGSTADAIKAINYAA